MSHSPHMASARDSAWRFDVATLPLPIRVGDSAEAISMLNIRDQEDGKYLGWMLMKQTEVTTKIVGQTMAKIKEVLEKNPHPNYIYIDNGLMARSLVKQLDIFLTEQQLPIQVVNFRSRYPRATARVEASYNDIRTEVAKMQGGADGGTPQSTSMLLTINEAEAIIGDIITRSNMSR